MENIFDLLMMSGNVNMMYGLIKPSLYKVLSILAFGAGNAFLYIGGMALFTARK
jgi:hypothetical protein